MSRASSDKARFEARVLKTRGGCSLFLGGVDKDGYGKFQITNPPGSDKPQRHVQAHRYAFKLKYKREPKGPLLHECDTRRCVRMGPKHVHEGTQKRNVRTTLVRGRHPGQKLTPEDVRTIRRTVKPGPGAVARIKKAAVKWGVSEQTMRAVVYRITWTWVT